MGSSLTGEYDLAPCDAGIQCQDQREVGMVEQTHDGHAVG